MSRGQHSIINGKLVEGSMAHRFLGVLAGLKDPVSAREMPMLCRVHSSHAYQLMNLLHKAGAVSIVRHKNRIGYKVAHYAITDVGCRLLGNLITPAESYRICEESAADSNYQAACRARLAEEIERRAKSQTHKPQRATPPPTLRSITRRYYREWRAKFARWESHDEAYYVARHQIRTTRVDGTGQYAEAS